MNRATIFLFVVGVLAIAAASSAPVHAQSYPSKVVRLIVPFPPGGISDMTGRLLAQKLSDGWKQPVIVDNRTGAGGMIGADYVAKSPADGYTVLVGSTSEVVINQHLYTKMSYHPEKDFAPVTLASITPLILVVHPSLPVRSVRELVALARARPGQLTFASSGTGSALHLAGELLKATEKVEMIHVPYKGAGPAMADLLGGQVLLFFAGMPPAIPQVRAGKLRALAVTTVTRSSAAPDVPTMAEAGIAGFEISNWIGVFLPAATSKEIVARLHLEAVRVLKQPDVKEKFVGLGAEAVGSTPEELDKFVKAESSKYLKLVKAAGVRAE
jgi:tripartite-type tricarboxylate transporter receptor subunit TctC